MMADQASNHQPLDMKSSMLTTTYHAPEVIDYILKAHVPVS